MENICMTPGKKGAVNVDHPRDKLSLGLKGSQNMQLKGQMTWARGTFGIPENLHVEGEI